MTAILSAPAAAIQAKTCGRRHVPISLHCAMVADTVTAPATSEDAAQRAAPHSASVFGKKK
jgi:hypothetical protein